MPLPYQLVDLGAAQDVEAGDGTTSVVVLAGAILTAAEKLLDRDNPTDVSWLSVTPTSGSVAGGASTDATVTVDTAGLANGDYSANLCVASNDPDEPVVTVPVNVTVAGGGGGPNGIYNSPVLNHGVQQTIGGTSLNVVSTTFDDAGLLIVKQAALMKFPTLREPARRQPACTPGAMLMIIWRMKNGERRSGPRTALMLICSMSVPVPPSPEPTMTAVSIESSPSRRGGRLAMSIAARVATSAIWVVRSLRRISLRSSTTDGSKSGTSPAIFEGTRDASKAVMDRTPEWPARRRPQKVSASEPRGVTAP